MVANGLLRMDAVNARYHNVPPATNAQHSYDDPAYRTYIAKSMARARSRMIKSNSNKCLFATQTFLVKPSSMEALSKELSRVVREFADSSDDEEGESIAEIVIALTHNFD